VIVDSHAHVDEVPALGWMDPASALIELLDDAHIDRAIVMTYTELPAVNPNALEYLAEQIARYPDRLIGYVRVHPWYPEVLDLIERAFGEFNMKGIKLHPVGNLAHPASDASLNVIRRAAAHHARCCSTVATRRSPHHCKSPWPPRRRPKPASSWATWAVIFMSTKR